MECKAQGINRLSYLYSVEPFNRDLCLDTTQAPTVTWNDTIASDAEVWATYLADNNVFEHATNLGQLDQGENLYLVSVQPTEPCTDATKAFYEEIKDYNFDQPGFSSQTGHFTQVMMYRCETVSFTGKGIHSNNKSMGMCRRYRR